MKAAMLGPNGRASSAAMYCSAVPGLVLVDRVDDVFAGDGFHPPERSPASSLST